jgi:hypothetical protein
MEESGTSESWNNPISKLWKAGTIGYPGIEPADDSASSI